MAYLNKGSQNPSLPGRVGVGLVFILLSSTVQAQTFAEWWIQRKTQLKYLQQQIVALQVYGGYVRQGYQLTQQGLGSVTAWTGKEWSLHAAYYASLKAVKPLIQNDPKALEIFRYASAIPGQFDQLAALTGPVASQQAYITAVRQKVLQECSRDIDQLQLVMTSGKAEMTDDERIERLDQLYASMKERYAFTLAFGNQVKILSGQMQGQQAEIQTERRLYAIP
ncbi:hypothetical protein ABDD95_20335 [Mucilaginibacter sp. PAMB04274]|uniref:hypothetical protein n=1 Tax=Mucilaginibacter sp. PAMB04274 TaxID=3138568 RepID=UPI0031F67075